jgi:hypothetical protein
MLDDMRLENSLLDTSNTKNRRDTSDGNNTEKSHIFKQLFKQRSHFKHTESEADIAMQTSAMYKSTNSIASQVLVWVRINFENIGDVDTMNEKYQALVRVKCKWYHLDDTEEVDDYDPKRYWYPKLYIENALHDVKEEITYKTTKSGNGRILITETRVAKGSFWER